MSESVEEVRPRRRTQAQRRAETRASVLTAARTVFLRRGVRGASLEEVAEEAGVSRGAVYYNFATKERLFLALLRAQCVRRAEELERIASQPSDGGANVQRAAMVFLDTERDAGWTRLLVEFTGLAAERPELRTELAEELSACREAVVRVIEQRLREAGLHSDAILDQLTTGTIALANGLALERAANPGTPVELLPRFIDLIITGLQATSRVAACSHSGAEQPGRTTASEAGGW